MPRCAPRSGSALEQYLYFGGYPGAVSLTTECGRCTTSKRPARLSVSPRPFASISSMTPSRQGTPCASTRVCPLGAERQINRQWARLCQALTRQHTCLRTPPTARDLVGSSQQGVPGRARSTARVLMRVSLESTRLRLPLGQIRVLVLTKRHLHFRQTLPVEDLVFRDDLVDGEQIRRERVDLVWG